MPDPSKIGPRCLFKNDPPICVRTVGEPDESKVCSMCRATLPQMLHTELEKVRDRFRDTNTYNQWLQKIEEQWKTTDAHTDGTYACVARQSRFRNPNNPTGKLLIKGVAEARLVDNEEILVSVPEGQTYVNDDVRYADCLPVKQAGRLCLKCSVSVRVEGSDELKELFNDNDTDVDMEVTKKVIDHANQHPYP